MFNLEKFPNYQINFEFNLISSNHFTIRIFQRLKKFNSENFVENWNWELEMTFEKSKISEISTNIEDDSENYENVKLKNN